MISSDSNSGSNSGSGSGEESKRTCRATVTLTNRHGLHARPASLWVQTAHGFASNLRVARAGDESVDGKSIMGMMMLAAENGSVLDLVAEGPDCEEQIRALLELVASRFGEE